MTHAIIKSSKEKIAKSRYDKSESLGKSKISFKKKVKIRKEIVYPESDGKPMADNTLQFEWIVKIKEGLEILFKDNPDVFVAGDFFWYPVEGNNKIRVAPDVLAVFGRPKGHRGSYLQWKEKNIAPQVVFEVLSPGNTPSEMERKLEFYEKYGVEEYYLYDPDRIKLKGWIRSDDKLDFIEKINGWTSPRLKIRFEIKENDMSIFRSDGQKFMTPLEISLISEQEKQRANQEWQRAEQEKQRATQEWQRAEQEKQRADRLAAKLKELGFSADKL